VRLAANLPLHHLQPLTHHQTRLRRPLHILRRQPRSHFLQHQPPPRHPYVRHLRHNRIHNPHASQRQRALLQTLRRAVFRRVLHRHHHTPRPGHQIHRAAHPLHHFSRDHPIRQAPRLIHFHRSQHTQINVRPPSGYGPIPSIPFSDCNTTSIPAGT